MLVRTLAWIACVSLLVPLAARSEEKGAGARSIERAGQEFLERNPAPREIDADWVAWVGQAGTGVWDRPGLTRAERSLITIAVLSVLREEAPLRVHVEAGIANGLSREQIAEVIMHTALYAGVPQALRGMRVAREVFDAMDAAEKPAP